MESQDTIPAVEQLLLFEDIEEEVIVPVLRSKELQIIDDERCHFCGRYCLVVANDIGNVRICEASAKLALQKFDAHRRAGIHIFAGKSGMR